MNILCIGDVVGSNGCRFLRARLPQLKKLKQIDLVVANGENSADGNGITPASFDYLLTSGVDVVTTGNHSFRRKESYPLYEEKETLLRPANYPEGSTPGRGMCLVDLGRVRVAVINLMGTVYLESLACPFAAADKLIAEAKKETPIIIVDFHAEATGEKRALGYYVDGRVSGMFGTHTHVPTADECVLPQGTGYITDAGMTGAVESVLGVKPEIIIEKMKTKLPVRFEWVTGSHNKMDCVLFEVEEKTGRCRSAERFQIQ